MPTPERSRSSVRLLVTDGQGSTLLFLNAGASGAGSEWWITPGGDVESEESVQEVALRELREELGSELARNALIGPLVATREGVHRYGGVERAFHESYFPVTCVDTRDISFENFTAEEQSVIRAFTWCTREQLDATDDVVWPSDLGVIWDRAVQVAPGLSRDPLLLRDRVDDIIPGGTTVGAGSLNRLTIERRTVHRVRRGGQSGTMAT